MQFVTSRGPLRSAHARLPLLFVLLATQVAAQSATVAPGQPGQAASFRHRTARFLQQATFGPTPELIDQVTEQGFADWIGAQRTAPPTLLEPFVTDLQAEVQAEVRSFGGLQNQPPEVRIQVIQILDRLIEPSWRYAWWQAAMTGPDHLRQRVAFALSEILVVSDQLAQLRNRPRVLASYYDVLLRGALGNYRDVLREVTLHAAMGAYLSHFNNGASQPDLGIFPDENYAREVMQLFSIGLDELNRDGTPKLDAFGERIPTYGNAEITEFAKIFTGLGPGEPEGEFGGRTDGLLPMRMYEDFHEQGEKTLLGGAVVPAGQSGMQDIEDALDNLFQHPNTAPFVSRRLIQRLTTSNPSPAYLDRIAAVFEDNGSGQRGDLFAVVRAILLDPEARLGDFDPELAQERGKLQEPWLRYVGLLRAFRASSPSGQFLNRGGDAAEALAQHPLSAPSVFNFFQPDFRPNGPVAAAGLTAPEFQITNSSTVISVTNWFERLLFSNQIIEPPLFGLLCLENLGTCVQAAQCDEPECARETLLTLDQEAQALLQQYSARLDLDDEIALATAGELDLLIGRIGLLLTARRLSTETREAVLDAISPLEAPEARVRVAIYLIAISPEAAVAQ